MTLSCEVNFVDHVTDDHLEALATAHSPDYYRSRDRQVFAFRIGTNLIIGPTPEPRLSSLTPPIIQG
jgi:hypothetical protein